jgi:hypothetical protein
MDIKEEEEIKQEFQLERVVFFSNAVKLILYYSVGDKLTRRFKDR